MWYRQPAIIVLGSGRSGTSTVARLCHTRIGVCMGHVLKQGDPLNPNGYYEDWISHSMIQMMVNNNYPFGIDVWLQAMNYQHQVCSAWGVKDPWLLFLQAVWGNINPALVVHCTRNLDATVNSWLKVWQSNLGNHGMQAPQEVIDHYVKLTQDRQILCEQTKNVWTNHVSINFDTPQEEHKIVDLIDAKLPDWAKGTISPK